MIEIHIIISIVVLCLFSFLDIIVFNEEILLTLCFLSFLFYCFNALSESIAASFESRAAKFEQDLLITFAWSKSTMLSDFNTNLKSQFFVSKFSVTMSSLVYFLANSIKFLTYKSDWIYYQTCLIRLNELVTSNKMILNHYHESCVTKLLYSLILAKSSVDLTFLISSSKSASKLSELKNLTVFI